MIKAAQIQAINPEINWQEFLDCGARIRQRNTPFSFPFWKDSDNISMLMKTQPEVNYRFWMITDDGEEGRIGAYFHPDEKTGYLGWYECDDNDLTSLELLQTAIEWLSQQGITEILGPINGSSWYAYRFNLTNEIPLFPGEPFQPMYYVDQWEKIGLMPSIYYQSAGNHLPELEPFPEIDMKGKMAKKGLDLLPFTPELYETHRSEILNLLNLCFNVNPLFTSVEMEEFRSLYDHLPAMLSPEFAYLLLDENQIPIGLYIAYLDPYYAHHPDLSPADIPTRSPKLIFKTIATHPRFQNQGFSSNMVRHFYAKAQKKGLPYMFMVMMYDENISAKTGHRKFPMKQVRQYALFQKSL